MLTFYRHNGRWLAGGFLLVFFSCFGQTFFISMWGGEIREEYGLTHGSFGAIYMIATLASAATLPILGRILDRASIATCAAGVIIMLAAAAVLMFYGTGLAVLVAAIYLLRLFGQGMMTHTAITAMGRWYGANRGKAVATASIGLNLAEGAMPSFFVLLATMLGWRESWLVAAGLLVCGALPAIWLLMRRERTPASRDGDENTTVARSWTRGEMLRDRLFWLSSLGIFAPPFIGTSIFFHQDYLIELNGWSPQLYYNSFALMAGTTLLVALLTGYVVDRWSAVRVMPFFLLPLGAGCLLLGSVSHPLAVLPFMVLLGCSYGITSTLFGALWPEMYGTAHLGSVRSVIMSMMVFLTAAGPGLTGALIDFGIPFSTQLVFMGAYCLGSIFVLRATSLRIRSRLQTSDPALSL